MSVCPYCKDSIEDRTKGVQCVKCGTPHHAECWDENRKCTIAGCESTGKRPLGKLATARRVIAIGRNVVQEAYDNARERFGGKSTIALFLLSSTVVGLGLAPLLYAVHASKKVDVEVVLGGLFLVLLAWITTLLYRGARLEDDLNVSVGERSLQQYYGGWNPGNGLSGCGDLGGCGGDLDGIVGAIVIGIALVVVIFVVLPLVAWLAVEVVFPIAVLAVYGALYHALAFAVNESEGYRGNLARSLARGAGFAVLYTGIVAAIMGAAFAAFHGHWGSVKF